MLPEPVGIIFTVTTTSPNGRVSRIDMLINKIATVWVVTTVQSIGDSALGLIASTA
jgi:hypothetical protein